MRRNSTYEQGYSSKASRRRLALKKLSLFLAVTLCCTIVFANSSKDSSRSSIITSFPFTLKTGGVIIIQARLDNFQDTLNFILDTGSGGISLDSSLVDTLKLPVTASDRKLIGLSSIRKISFVKDRTLRLPGLNVEHLDFHINDYELLTSTYGVRIDGIVGYSFFKRYIVKVDYDKNVVEVWSSGKIRYPKRGVVLRPRINNIPILNAAVSDGSSAAADFYFDSGAGLNMLMSEDFERDSTILRKGKKTILTQAEGIGGKKPMKMTVIKSISIGRYKFRKVPVHIFQDEYKVTNYPELGGLIGNDLLRRFNIILNYPLQQIHIEPNSHYSDAFDYSYTGLGIYVTEGKVVIEDVLKDSPGEKAGLRSGDVIIAIDNNFSQSIQTYKEMLQQVGNKLRMLIKRGDEVLQINLRVKSFYKETR